MTSARPAPCFITIHTTDGSTTHTNTEQLVPEASEDVTEPEKALGVLMRRLHETGVLTFHDGATATAVFAASIARLDVTPESDIGVQFS
jgi:hypothetical protein